jgi:predicted deacylase
VKRLGILTVLLLAGFASMAGAEAPAPAGSGPARAWGPIDMQSAVIEPGTKKKFAFTTDRSFQGVFLDTALWTIRGKSPGPTLCIVSGIHGDEINSIEIARRSFHLVDPQQLKGTLIVVPAANALGFRTMNRYMIDRRDLNRAFPGSLTGSVTSIVAHTLFERVIRRCEHLVDLHTGSNFRPNVAQIRVDMKHARSLALAENFGVGVIVDGAGPNGSLRREAVDAGAAAIIYEAGPPYVFLEAEIALGTQGIMNVMDYLEMYASSREHAKSRRVVASTWIRVPEGNGGIFLTDVKLGAEVKPGDLLGTVTDPMTDATHEIRATRAGVVIGAALPQVVLSGYGVFHIGQIE